MAKKARKWTNLPGEVPAEVIEVSEKELAIRAAADERRAGVYEDPLDGQMLPRRAKTMNELAQEYRDLCEEEEFEDLASKRRAILFEALERLIGEQLKIVQEMSGQDTWRGEGQLFSPQVTPIPVVHDKAALAKYIEDNKLQSLLTLEYPRLKSLVIDKLEELTAMTPKQRAAETSTLSDPLPGVKIFVKQGVHRTKS